MNDIVLAWQTVRAKVQCLLQLCITLENIELDVEKIMVRLYGGEGGLAKSIFFVHLQHSKMINKKSYIKGRSSYPPCSSSHSMNCRVIK